MGYRSDVAYKIKFDDEGQWNVFLLEAKSKPETRLCFEDEDLTVVHDKHEIRFVACAVKWYPDYPDVKCHHRLMELCDEYNERGDEYVCAWLFRRIGEEEDDIEHQTGGEPDWDWIELNRSLQVNW
jgi:hypothetical protein